MTNEELQKLVLDKLTELTSDMSEVKNRLGSVENKLGNVEGQLGNVEGRLANVEGRLANVEGQLGETNQIVKALLHNTETLGAEINGLKVNTASKEFAKRSEKMLTLLSAKAATKEDLAEVRTHLIDEMDALRTELKEDMSELETKISNDLKSIFEIAGEHEVKIRTLMRRPV